VIQLPVPASQSAAAGSRSGSDLSPQTIARAVASAVQSVEALATTGGGGFGKRILPEFPITLFLLGLLSVAGGSTVWFRRLGKQPAEVS
jgi:hypothetical protein